MLFNIDFKLAQPDYYHWYIDLFMGSIKILPIQKA